ncbi:PREDICTED: uncharacterized protein LOC104748404 [Camelina sativa]|uniref:Uncharacterized protein LOC104748404 n=1 Tax=Camelina sativa TaxID=90675 RepID=A0ABM0WB06_CAMSA|nr:PREDICTED: uncharacterized protein LOC104748404 [Camelina sativa]
MVRSDNGMEFMCLSTQFWEQGVLHQTSCVALLFQARLPIKFWGEAVLTTAYLINRTPSSIHKGVSPYEILHGCKPAYDQLRVFGSACYVHRTSRDKINLGNVVVFVSLLAMLLERKGGRFTTLRTMFFSVSRDVVFQETVFPYADHTETLSSIPPVSSDLDGDWILPSDTRVRGSPTAVALPPDTPLRGNLHDAVVVPVALVVPLPPSVSSSPVSSLSPAANVIPPPVVVSVTEPPAPVPLRHSERVCKDNVRLSDYVVNHHVLSPSTDTHHAPPAQPLESLPTVQGMSFFSLTDYVFDEQFSPGHRTFLATITQTKEPKNFKEAIHIKV